MNESATEGPSPSPESPPNTGELTPQGQTGLLSHSSLQGLLTAGLSRGHDRSTSSNANFPPPLKSLYMKKNKNSMWPIRRKNEGFLHEYFAEMTAPRYQLCSKKTRGCDFSRFAVRRHLSLKVVSLFGC